MLATSIAAEFPQYLILGIKILALATLGFWGVRCLGKFGDAMQDQPPGVETSWGGLGGSLGGWSMSKSLAWLLLTLVSLVLFAVVALQLGNEFAPPGNDARAQPQAPTGATNHATVDRSSSGATGSSAASSNPAPQNAKTE